MKKWWVEEFFFWLEPLEDRKWRRRDIFWLPVDTPALAKWARGWALLFTTWYGFMWTLYALFGILAPGRYEYWLLLYAIVWNLIVWGLLKMRPEAAVMGLVLSAIILIGQFEVFLENGNFWPSKINSGFFISIVEVWAFVQAIRGTFAYQKLDKV